MTQQTTPTVGPVQPVVAGDPLSQSADIVTSNIDRIRELFPDAVTENGIDFEALQQLLGEEIDDSTEKFGLNWPGKKKARQAALVPSTGTLLPEKNKSVDWDATQNIFIEGDNLEVLKLLQKSYAGEVKMIYIDPPYNTGNEFVYEDDFSDGMQAYLKLERQMTEDGVKLQANTDASGRKHSKWLTMMYPRLRLARNLMKNDGVVFVSCDQNELSRLLLTLDDVFGEDNLIGHVVWQRSKKGDAKLIASVHEYIVCYAKSKAAVIANGPWRKPKDGADQVLAHYDSLREAFGPDHSRIRTAMLSWYKGLSASDPRKAHKHYSWSDARGLYFAADFAGPDDGRASRPRHDIIHPTTGRPCKKPSTGWRWDTTKTDWALAQDPPRIHFGPDETTIPNRKSYLSEISSEPFSSVFYRDGRSATLEVESLVGKGVFQFPKNTDVLAELIQLASDKSDIVLDFFAGSGSTGHAVMKQNATDHGQRRFILVQLGEPIEAGEFFNIADVTRKRLTAAGTSVQATMTHHMDTGFRSFKLAESNIKQWRGRPETLAEDILESVVNLDPDRDEYAILFELMIKLGLDLTTPIGTKVVEGHTLYSIGFGAMYACLSIQVDNPGSEELGRAIVQWSADENIDANTETSVVFRDAAFTDDMAKLNLATVLEQSGFPALRTI